MRYKWYDFICANNAAPACRIYDPAFYLLVFNSLHIYPKEDNHFKINKTKIPDGIWDFCVEFCMARPGLWTSNNPSQSLLFALPQPRMTRCFLERAIHSVYSCWTKTSKSETGEKGAKEVFERICSSASWVWIFLCGDW